MSATFPFRLAVFDMDDTLLGPDKKLSDENRHALDRLRAAGVEVVIASGRYRANVAIFEQRLGFQGWVISSGGAVVSHAATDEIVYEITVPRDLAVELVRRARELGVSLIGYHRDGIFCDQLSELVCDYRDRTGQVPVVDCAPLTDSGLQKLIWMTVPERITELTPQMLSEYQGRLYVVNTERDMIDFMSPKVNKARAVEALAARLGIGQEDVVTFGDGNNDVPMLEWAGLSVAMAHGKESARRAAKKVSPPGDPATAVARSIETFFSL